MPQANIFTPFVDTAGTQTSAIADTNKVALSGQGASSSLNISVATVVKAAAGRLVRIAVNTAGSTAGTANDVATIAGVAAANLICEIPNTVGVILVDWPCSAGITITPGTGQVVSVSYL